MSGHEWDPTEDVQRFVALLSCNNRNCGEHVSVVGNRYTQPAFDPEDGMSWTLEFHPTYFGPPLHYFNPPSKCPKEIVDEIINSFGLLRIDASGAAGRLRVAVERLLDTQGIKARARRSGRIVRLSTHERIELFRKAKPALGEALMAVKWIGNAGAHDSTLTVNDVFDGYDIVEHVLDEVVTERIARVQDLAKEINRRRGPRRPKNTR
jgi:hypothetical protein